MNINTPSIPPRTPTWGNAFTRSVGRFLLFLLGWQFKGEIPNVAQAVLIAAPHTSAWDWPIGMFAIFAVGVRVYWLGKAEFVNGRFRKLLVKLGGIPVDRSAPNGVVGQTAVQFQTRPQFLLALAPEGTRRYVKRWKLGFYYIAREANVPIVPVALDYGRRCIDIGPAILPDDDLMATLEQIAQFYAGVKGKHPAKAAVSHQNITNS